MADARGRQYLLVIVSNLELVDGHIIRFSLLSATFTLDQIANWRAGIGCLLEVGPYDYAFRLGCLHTRHLLLNYFYACGIPNSASAESPTLD